MAISAQVAVYPLRQSHLSPAVEAVVEALRDCGLTPIPGPMSTYVVGDDPVVFAGLQQAYARASALGHVVMTVTLSVDHRSLYGAEGQRLPDP